MVQWFSPEFLDCTQRFKTRITSSIPLDAGMGWGVLDSSCAAARFHSVPDLNLVVCDRVSSLNVDLKWYETIAAGGLICFGCGLLEPRDDRFVLGAAAGAAG